MPPVTEPALRPYTLPALELHCPARLDGVLAHLGEGCRALAGGTDLILWASQRGEPRRLVWTGGAPELQTLECGGGRIRVGAAVSLSRLVRNDDLRRAAPAVAEGVQVIGSVQLRNQATLAGNVCTASPAGDTLPGLLVHEALVELADAAGATRRLALHDFLLGPGRTALAPGELVVRVEFTALGESEVSVYRRFTERRALDLAFAGVAARLAFARNGQRVAAAHLALGAVGATALDAAQAATTLIGRPLGSAERQACARAAAAACTPISDHRASAEYRRHLVEVLVCDVLAEAQARARQRGIGA